MLAAAAAGLLLSVACVAPAPSFTAYEGKAGASAASALSAVRTAALTAGQLVRRRTFEPYGAIVLQQAESDASSVQSQFSSIQPPDPPADQLRTQLVPLLTRASGVLAELRIAARRGDRRALAARSAVLSDIAVRLERFAEAHE
jgi:hypothetical protein